VDNDWRGVYPQPENVRIDPFETIDITGHNGQNDAVAPAFA